MNLKVVISTFNEINPDELWLLFGTESNLGIYLSMKLMLTQIPEFVLHAYFPNVSCIYSMQYCLSMLWQRQEDSLEYMESLSWSYQEFPLLQTETIDLAMEMLEQFLVLLYDRTSDITNVNDNRKYLVTQKTRSLGNLPPLTKCCQTTHQTS